eukprot:TRINITY_DN1556_c0_g1_i1.p1 TRINITY_DN1556_c0_g1~~TRINITY_DN1556_c0_g1_i1.p1  ORF type:complete len:467 (+),score=120.56 TRINITY_DN1556_c0_g1_i1:659-2059(+)
MHRELQKMKHQLEEEKKNVMRLELALEAENERFDSEKGAAQQLLRAVERDVGKGRTGRDVLLDIEELIRELYYRDGASLHLEELEDEHRENINFSNVVNDIRDSVDKVIEEMIQDFFKRDPFPKKSDGVVRDITTLREFSIDVKREKNSYVRACNSLGKQYEAKSALEQQMRRWKEKLVEIALDESQCRPDNEKLMEDIDTVKALLRKDTAQREDVRGNRKTRISARNTVQSRIDHLRKYIHADLEAGERRRMQGLLRELKDVNRKLEGAEKRAVTAQKISVTKDERARITRVVRLMLQNHRPLFRNYLDSDSVEKLVHPMVRIPIHILEDTKGIECPEILDKSDVAPDQVEDLMQIFRLEEDIPEDSDPYIIGEMLKEFLRSLNEPLLTYKRYPAFDAINDLSSKNAVDELGMAIEELPKVRRATLAYLITFLSNVERHSRTNQMDTDRLADVFGPLLLRPFKDY